MSLRRRRVHFCGLSNIDFRTKNDKEALKIYQPWKYQTAFGSMGYSGYHLPIDQFHEVFDVSKEVNMQRNIAQGSPDPKVCISAKFYNQHKIPLYTRTLYTNEKVAELDESFKGKDKFTGDSMMIADINKFRRERKRKKNWKDVGRKKKELRQENIIKDKTEKNKEAYQETQLVNIDAEVTLESKVDINKLLEIRLGLRRRYANRTNFRKIFKDWDQSIEGELSVYDAHSMINKLNIPINYNETRALIASSNTRGTETLNLEEFMHLIFSDNPALNVDLKKLKYKEEKLYNEGAQIEALKKNMKLNIKEMSKTDELNFLEQYLRTKKPIFTKNISEAGCTSDTCDLETLTKALRAFPLPEKYVKDPIVKAIFDKYSENEGMNYRKFIDDCMNKKEKNDFFDFQEKYLGLINEKLDKCKKEVENAPQILNNDNEIKALTRDTYKLQIEQKKKFNDEFYRLPKPDVNNCQPSTAFINKVHGNAELYHKILNDVENTFSPLPSLIKEIIPKTRYGANPIYLNTALNIQPDVKSAMYQNEKDRFNIKGLGLIDFVLKEREMGSTKRKKKLERISNAVREFQNVQNESLKVQDQKESIAQMFQTKRLHTYEYINKMRNEIIE